MGFYKDPYSKFGQLTYEMWRAVRLVVDTGLHSMGWTREQAIDFFRANAAKTEQDIMVEVDRYIVWPGQALGYKMGQLKIRELRTSAEQQLGPRFDVRQFHDVVLGQGAVPLDALERQVSRRGSRRAGAIVRGRAAFRAQHVVFTGLQSAVSGNDSDRHEHQGRSIVRRRERTRNVVHGYGTSSSPPPPDDGVPARAPATRGAAPTNWGLPRRAVHGASTSNSRAPRVTHRLGERPSPRSPGDSRDRCIEIDRELE